MGESGQSIGSIGRLKTIRLVLGFYALVVLSLLYLRFLPPLVMSTELLHEAFDVVAAAFDATA